MLDTDWNEQADITINRIETGTIDIIGDTGAPFHYAGFEIIAVNNTGIPTNPGTNIQISEGRFYVDGMMCENDAGVLFADQPDFDKTLLPTAPGRYIFYLDAWLLHISVLEDPAIREVALGGPDTTTRSKTTWQVKYITVNNTSTCVDALPAAITSQSTGQLKARAELPAGTDNPCGLAAGGGYRRLENQLYRVEIHKGGASRANATFKWSRDNGSVAVKWESIDASNANNLIVSSTGRDELLGFRTGDWIELIDDTTDLLGLPGIMVQLTKVDDNVLTINPGGNTITLSNKNPRIRRWDSSTGEIALNTNNNTWVPLEEGVEVNFKEGTFKTGDYWLIPARTVTADIEWPKDNAGVSLDQPPQGIRHHFAKLAILDLVTGASGIINWVPVSDCRPIFPPLTELVSLYYVGGDGQEAMPGKLLPNTFKVGVANGQWAVSGARVKFEIIAPGAGTLNPVGGIAITNGEGIAECQLTLGTMPPNVNFSLQVKASLLDAAGNISARHLPVIFNASFSMAENVSYKSNCDNWTGTAPDTVAKALDELCERRGQSKGCSYTIGPKGDFKTLLEAIEKLFKKEKDVSLCFMPGDHIMDEEIIMLQKEMSFTTLKITGFAARLTMRKAKKMQLVADKIILQGLSVIANPDNKDKDETQIILSAGETIMDYCSWFKGGTSDSPFIVILKEGLVYLKNNKIIAWFSLILANGVQGIIESNLISYLLLQNGNSFDFKPVPLIWLTTDAKTKIRSNLLQNPNDEIKMTDWSLVIRGNRIGIVLTDVNRAKPHELYQNMIVSENIFQFGANSFAAKYLNIINNQFLFEDPNHKPVVVSYILGFNLVVMGNSSFTAKLHSVPTGLINSIDAIDLSMIVGKGSGPAQILNLVNVIA